MVATVNSPSFGPLMSHPLRRPAPYVLALALAGCAAPPDIGISQSETARRADYPVILPLSDLLAQRPDVASAQEIAAPLAQRASALRNRATGLRAPIVDAATRSRMQDALNRR